MSSKKRDTDPNGAEHFAYIDGRFIKETQLKIPVISPALQFGYGLFETIRGYNYQPFMLSAHLERMRQSAKFLKIPCSMDSRKTYIAIVQLLKLNNLKSAHIKIILLPAVSKKDSSVIILTKKLQKLSSKFYRDGVNITISKSYRDSNNFLYRHKTLNYLANILARESARRKKAFEAIFVDNAGRVLEGTSTNICIVKNNKVYTPPVTLGILPGITRQIVIDICKREGISFEEKEFTLATMKNADEIFLTNSLIEILPVRCIEGGLIYHQRKPGIITKTLLSLYRRLTKG